MIVIHPLSKLCRQKASGKQSASLIDCRPCLEGIHAKALRYYTFEDCIEVGTTIPR